MKALLLFLIFALPLGAEPPLHLKWHLDLRGNLAAFQVSGSRLYVVVVADSELFLLALDGISRKPLWQWQVPAAEPGESRADRRRRGSSSCGGRSSPLLAA